MKDIRKATKSDVSRIAEIEIFNYRLYFYPIFKDDGFYFNELRVPDLAEKYKSAVGEIWVYDDGAVKGFIQIENQEIKKLFVEPILQGGGIGSKLLNYVMKEFDIRFLWALEKNGRAIDFYKRHGFRKTGEKKLEEDTTEYLVRLQRQNPVCRTDAGTHFIT